MFVYTGDTLHEPETNFIWGSTIVSLKERLSMFNGNWVLGNITNLRNIGVIKIWGSCYECNVKILPTEQGFM